MVCLYFSPTYPSISLWSLLKFIDIASLLTTNNELPNPLRKLCVQSPVDITAANLFIVDQNDYFAKTIAKAV